MTLVGSRTCPATLRLREFLTRNALSARQPRARSRCRGAGAARALPRDGGRDPGGDRPLRPGVPPAERARHRRIPEHESGGGPFGRARRGRRRRRARRPVGGDLRRLRRAVRARHRIARLRRPGRLELEDRELPRLPHRDLGAGARRPGIRAGAEVRRERHRRRRRGAAGLLRTTVWRGARRRARGARAHRDHRHRRAVPRARDREPAPVHRRRRVPRRDPPRSEALPGRGSGGRRRRQLGGAGGGVSRERLPPRAHPGALGGIGREHVGVPDPPHRGAARISPCIRARSSPPSRATASSSASRGTAPTAGRRAISRTFS